MCRAIQHAHNKGVIHLGIKPSNVLVSDVDGKALVKAIDFGVAKAIAPDPDEAFAVTRQGTLIGTPEYLSPEQAVAGRRDVDTRTDVYALGLLLYALLVGRPPFAGDGNGRVDLDEIRRRVREVEPPRPSSALRASGAAAEAIARTRRAEPQALARALRGDLDWIVVKALEKDPARRYASPLELAADSVRYLKHEPVSAGPPGRAYRARKFVRRHRLGVGATAVVLILLVGFAVAMAIQAGRIANERDRANREAAAAGRVSQFLVDLFRVSDPSQARGEALSAREILDSGAARIEAELKGDPETQARMMATMGAVYKNLGSLEPAAVLLDKARAIRRAALGAGHPDTIRTSLEIAELLFLRGQLAEAEALLRESLATARAALGENHPHTMSTLADLAVMVHHRGRLEEAESLYRDALERRRAVLGPDHPETLETTNNVAALLMAQGKAQAAEPYLRAALEGRRRALDAEPLCREAVAINRRIRPEHPKTSVSINNLGKLLDLQGRYGEAEPLYREAEEFLAAAVAAARRALAGDHVVTGYTLRRYGRLLGRTGRPAEAEQTLAEAYRMLSATAGPAHAQTQRAAADLEEVRATRRPPV